QGIKDSGVTAPVYNLRVADYHTYFVGNREWSFSVWAHNACHGNSYASQKLTTLYQLVTKKGQQFLKWGISSNPTKRYPAKYMADKLMIPVNQGQRRMMATLERANILVNRGPLNNEALAASLL